MWLTFIKKEGARQCIVVAVGLAAWIGFGAVEDGGLPAWEFADTEVSTNVPFAFPQVNVVWEELTPVNMSQ